MQNQHFQMKRMSLNLLVLRHVPASIISTVPSTQEQAFFSKAALYRFPQVSRRAVATKRERDERDTEVSDTHNHLELTENELYSRTGYPAYLGLAENKQYKILGSSSGLVKGALTDSMKSSI